MKNPYASDLSDDEWDDVIAYAVSRYESSEAMVEAWLGLGVSVRTRWLELSLQGLTSPICEGPKGLGCIVRTLLRDNLYLLPEGLWSDEGDLLADLCPTCEERQAPCFGECPLVSAADLDGWDPNGPISLEEMEAPRGPSFFPAGLQAIVGLMYARKLAEFATKVVGAGDGGHDGVSIRSEILEARIGRYWVEEDGEPPRRMMRLVSDLIGCS